MAKSGIYYFIDIHLISRLIENYGESTTATHDGNTEDAAIHRMFVPKGQYNKLVTKLSEFELKQTWLPTRSHKLGRISL